MPDILLEICCGSMEDVVAAEQGGAHRVELCSALFLGGLTPSLGTLIETKKRSNIPIMAMVRPRAGGFCYSAGDLEVMEQDAHMFVQNGADGIVFGILNEDGSIDVQRSRRIRDQIGDRHAVFHRAFDVTPDPFRALDELIDLGVTRVLTSGQQSSAPQGAPLIRRLIDYSNGRIEILPGGGIHLPTIDDLISKTGCSQVHLAAPSSRDDRSTLLRPSIRFGSSLYPSEARYEVTDMESVKRVAKQISEAVASSEENSTT